MNEIEMKEIETDLNRTKSVLNGIECESFSIGKIYPTTNEDLEWLFNCFSVKNKDVFTVLASSDQLFCTHYNGARSVETFDKNKLTKHYYYLRTWLLKYEGRFYPTPEEIMGNNDWICNLLCQVQCESIDEELSYRYWSCYVASISGFLGSKLFHRCSKENITGIKDITLLLNIIEEKELIFKCQNMHKEIDRSRKYDTIIMSNILEYTSFNKEYLLQSRDNLYEILKDDGEVICSNMLGSRPSKPQQEVFLEKFDYELFDSEDYLRGGRAVGYCYRKKNFLIDK